MNPEDHKFMRQALDLARQGRALASPNPMVGAVIVNSAGEEAGSDFYTYGGLKHAEVLAIEQAGEAARGGTLYASLEPCCFEGRTAACTEAVFSAGLKRVVAAIEDAHPKVSGAGFDQLRQAGIEIELAGEFAAEAGKLNEAVFHFNRTGKPLVILKSALTLDGKISAPDDNTGWITSDTAREHVQQVRHDCDAILTGIGTVLADDCLLTDRTGLPRRRPLLRVVTDSLLRLPLSSRLVKSANDDLAVMTTSAAPAKRRQALEQAGVTVQVLDGPRGRVDLPAVVDWLGRRQHVSLLIEAGAKLNWAVLDLGVVDKTLLYYAPKILGGVDSLPMAGGAGRRSRSGAIRLRGVEIHSVGLDEFAVEAYLEKQEAAANEG
jgi:diaminohydroxyphosphoribosylaminopyrimidine deaminase/5-amino-6-(5-phosphoribosylamino)uracil reductase